MISVGIISCEKEKDKNNDDSGNTATYSMVEGIWAGKEEGYDSSYTLSFNEDGTGTFVNKVKNSGSGGYYTESATFSYFKSSANGGVIVKKHRDPYDPGYSGLDFYYFAIDNNKLYLMEGDDGVVLSLQ